MDVAVKRLIVAIQQKQKIAIYGDYDVDGTTSVALLYLFFKHLGLQPDFYIPDRMKEGYGLSADGIREIHSWGVDLVITTDCGITAVEEVKLANQLNLETIICDHHEPADILPDALAILNPKRKDCNYPFKELAGVGVAFKLIQGIGKALQLDKETVFQFLDLVAIGSAADIVPLMDENRVLVNAGIVRLNTTKKVGIRALLASSGLHSHTISTGQIVFTIAPRINAVGRLGNADRAVHLLITDSHAQANNIATILEAENRNRRNIDEDTFGQALSILEQSFDSEKDKVIVLSQEDWHPGVIGIVASRIVEKYYRPTVMITLENGVGKGSARSVPGFDIYKALKSCDDLMLGFGGHKYAAGLSIPSENISLFRSKLNLYAQNVMDENILIPKIRVDSKLKLNEIDARLVRILNLFAPFGPQNMRPVFLSRNLQVVGTPQIVGNNHLKFKVRQNGVAIDAIGFNLGDLLYRLEPGKKNLDMVFTIDENEYLGRTTLQLRVKDLR
jgi:single-stranded-DNA-specific exonuclease